VSDLIIIRACQLLRPRQHGAKRDFAPPGFRRRLCKRLSNRAVGGVWLRRHLNVRGNFVTQVRRLIEALRHIRGLAACLAWRRRSGMTRVSPIILTRAISAPLRARSVAPATADSS
jgi:hypothetical protein